MTTPTDRLTIGPMLAAARERAGLSQRQLAASTGVAPSAIGTAESQSVVYPAILDRLIPALDLDRDEAYHAAGRIAPEILDALTADLPTVRRLRRELGL